MVDNDIIVDMLNAILEAVKNNNGSFDQSVAVEIERQMKVKYGGDTPYIHKKTALVDKKKAAVEEVKKTGKPMVAAKRYGVSRSEIYRLLREKK